MIGRILDIPKSLPRRPNDVIYFEGSLGMSPPQGEDW